MGVVRLDSRAEERRASDMFGVDLTLHKSYITDKALARAQKRIPLISRVGKFDNEDLERLTLQGPHALVIDDPLPVLRDVHDLCFAHYIIGIKENFKGSFPDYCCGMSSINLFVNLLHHGYSNTLFANNHDANHCYALIPVIHAGKPGVIIADPTAQQLWKSKTPRVSAELRTGKWKYNTDWAQGADLFPTRIITPDTLRRELQENQRVGRQRTNLYECENPGVKEHLAVCYSNPRSLKNKRA
jgi:hypothetical protein